MTEITLTDTPNLPAAEDDEDKRFRRPNRFVPLRVGSGGTLTLLSRKLLNTIIFHTQQLGAPGQDAPPDQPGENINSDYYWLPLTRFTTDANFNSSDVLALRAALDNLTNIKLHKDTEHRLSSGVLLADYQIVNPTGKRGTKVMVGWELTAAVREAARNPDIYAWANVHHLNFLQTTAGIALFEIAQRYVGNESGLTMRESVDYWFDALTGVPVGTKAPEYKYFKRDVIKESMAEVNSLTNLNIELIEHKVGRRVTELQFCVTEKRQVQITLSPPPIINTQLVQRIMDFGVTSKEAEKLFASTEEGLLKATVLYVEERLATIEAPAAYFRIALRDKYAQKQNKKTATGGVVQPQSAQITDQESEPKDPARERAMKAFEALPPPERTRTLERFSETLQEPLAGTYRKQGMGSQLVRKAIEKWLLAQAL